MAVAERYAKLARWRERSVLKVRDFIESEVLKFRSIVIRGGARLDRQIFGAGECRMANEPARV
ncbi:MULTISPECIES: hypothetical protein [Leptolyngbya]|uniref:hypothetical protein n=1 Tax=Leptolyngbya TaxID=47251 RepID=UPI0016824BA2|nr:hypothetical protein [Leptolyngbya sp. FACHB-1624]MBD1859949.1 hypothetical protein [Leptolyngbya sp. FACHB-1624]